MIVYAKLTLFVFFVENLVMFVISLLEFTMETEEFSEREMRISYDVQVIYNFLHKFATTYFNFKIVDFFWQKLFADDKNVLSRHQNTHFVS